MNAVNLITLPRLDPRHQLRGSAPLGSSIAAIVGIALPGLPADAVRVTIGDQVVSQEHWSRVRPKAGAVVVIRAIPRGDQDLLRSVLMIAVTIAAIAVGQLWLAPALATYGITGFTANAIVGLSTTALTIGGSLLINALIPPRPPLGDQKASPTYSIQGWKNVANPDGPIPSVLGTHRMAPPFAAMPCTEIVGDDQFIRAAFVFGYGPVAIRNIRIGETPITDFQDVSYEIREGYPSDEPLTLYTEQVIEDALSNTLSVKAGPAKRTTASDVIGASIDITFPGGLVAIRTQDKKSRQQPLTITFALRQRQIGTDPWIPLDPIKITAAQAGKTLRRTIRWNFPVRGRWEIEITRIDPDYDDLDQTNTPLQIVSRSMWTALRSFRPEYPIAFDEPLALAAVRIRASEQLNGSLDDFNADVSSICLDWDYASSSWIVRETQNPASLFRHVLQGPAMTYPLQDSEVAALEDWHEFCRVRGLKYNRVHDYEASVLDVLSDIAAAGRASPHDNGTSWGVVIDRALTVVEGHVSPRNSWGFSGERAYAERPDAFRVRFMDETNAYQNAERVVPWPGFDGDPTITEELTMPGITDPDLIWKEARRRQYETQYRPDTYTANQDFEHLVHTRGSLVRLSHDVLDRTQVSGRVAEVAAGTVTLDELVTMEAGRDYACRFRKADGQTLLRTVATVPGETQTLVLTGAGDLPAEGDLAMFGIASRESFEVIVKGIEVSDNLNGRITFVDHAPEIEALTDAEVPPPWDGRAGGPVIEVSGDPPVPIITKILSGQEVGTDPDAVMVMIQAGVGPITAARFQIRHRLVGASSWTILNVSSGESSANLTGYVSGETVEVQASAQSYAGTSSAWSGSQTHEIGLHDTLVPGIASFSADRDINLWRLAWAYADVPAGREAASIEGAQIRYRLGVWEAWADLEPLHAGALANSPWVSADPNSDEIHTFAVAAVTESGRRGAARIILAGRWRNLLQHSDDPNNWSPVVVDGITFGAAVADPFGGTKARAISFGANSGLILASASTADVGGKTFKQSLYFRAPAGKPTIALVRNTNSIFSGEEIALTSSWVRHDIETICAGGDTYISIGLSNQSAFGLSDTSAGVVEVYGGMIELGDDLTAYQSRP